MSCSARSSRGRYEVVSATTAVEGIGAFYHARLMTKTLVTGGTGFVGLHVVRELARRGDDLRLLVRNESNTKPLEGIEFERAVGDVTDRAAVREAVRGVERV